MDKTYYKKMLQRNRGYVVVIQGHVAGVITYFIGDNDNKYLHGRDPWTMLDDEPDGETLYIDQLLVKDNVKHTARIIHKEFTKLLSTLKLEFPNIKQVKWMRAPASFRKNKIRGEKPNVHCKSIK